MTDAKSTAVSPTAATNRYLPAMLFLFVGSGCAALVYEVVWLQQLSLVIGSSAVSLGVLLATFMGGMCIGSLALARYVSSQPHPLRVYALLEAGIGVCGILIMLLLTPAGKLYISIGGGGVFGIAYRAIISAIFLLPPTILMGATLPAIARYVETTPTGVSWLGFFYGGNIVGAVLGSLLAGFYLLRVHDMMVATLVAVALNAVVALAAYGLSGAATYQAAGAAKEEVRQPIPRAALPIYVAIMLSGLTALGSEVIWTRLLSLSLGGTTYTFSLILAGFLLALGIGSTAGSYMSRTLKNPRLAFGLCQLLIVVGLAWAAYNLTRAMPYWPINPGLAASPWYLFQIDFLRVLWTVTPSALLWGASFPLALAAVAQRGQDPGRLVGTVYAANTVGAILGSLVAALLMITWLGTQNAQRVFIGLAALSAVIVLAVEVTESRKITVNPRGALLTAVAIALAFLMAASVARVPALLVGYGRYAATWQYDHGEFIFTGEGMNSSMAVSQLSNGVLNYHNAGKVQASSEPQDMRLQRMLGHLATLLPENPRSVLVIGCGAGVTAGSASIDPSVEKLTIAEIERLVPEVVSQYFSEHNFDVVNNEKTVVQIDDARHFLLTTDETFDAITSDPFDPWVKGAATLYTQEFFTLMREKLNPGGVITVFVQLYEAGTAAVKSEVVTFFDVFPDGMIFANTNFGQGYDVVLVGMKDAGPIDIDRIESKLRQPEYYPVARSLSEIGFFSVTDLLATYASNANDLRDWLSDAQMNRDRNLRLQFLAGLGLNAYEQDEIYRAMVGYRTFPQNVFTGTEASLQALRVAMMGVQ